MTIKQTNTSGIRLVADKCYYVYGPLGGQRALDIYGTVGVRRLIEDSIPKDSRAKPANPLANMTARATQFRESIVYDRARQWTDYWDVGGYPQGVIRGRPWPNTGLNWGGSPNGFPTPTTDWGLHLRTKIAASAVNLGDTLVEYRETVRLFHDLAVKTVQVLKYIRQPWRWPQFAPTSGAKRAIRAKNRRKRRPLGAVQRLASTQLLVDFGITPLVNVLYDSLEVLSGRVQKPIIRKYNGTREGKSYPSAYIMSMCQGGEWVRSQKYCCYVRFYPNSKSFTAGNPLAGAWELLPWSWLIDQFVQVGKYLTALDALESVEAAYGYVTTLDRQRDRFYGSSSLQGVTPGTRLYTGIKRDLITKSSIPLPLPSWKPSNSFKAALHATEALLSHRR